MAYLRKPPEEANIAAADELVSDLEYLFTSNTTVENILHNLHQQGLAHINRQDVAVMVKYFNFKFKKSATLYYRNSVYRKRAVAAAETSRSYSHNMLTLMTVAGLISEKTDSDNYGYVFYDPVSHLYSEFNQNSAPEIGISSYTERLSSDYKKLLEQYSIDTNSNLYKSIFNDTVKNIVYLVTSLYKQVMFYADPETWRGVEIVIRDPSAPIVDDLYYNEEQKRYIPGRRFFNRFNSHKYPSPFRALRKRSAVLKYLLKQLSKD